MQWVRSYSYGPLRSAATTKDRRYSPAVVNPFHGPGRQCAICATRRWGVPAAAEIVLWFAA